MLFIRLGLVKPAKDKLFLFNLSVLFS